MIRKLTFLLLIGLLVIGNGLVEAAPYRQSPPVPLQYGQTLEGTLDANQSEVSFVFDATTGDQITATVAVSEGNLIPILALTNFSGTLLNINENSTLATNVTLSYVLPAGGAYLLKVSAAAATTGTFQILLQHDGNNQPDSPTDESTPEAENTPDIVETAPANLPPAPTPSPQATISTVTNITDARLQVIRIGTQVNGSLSDGDNFNLYAFEGREGQQVSLVPDSNTGFQPLLVLYSSDFTEIFRSQPGQTLNASLPSSALYFIAAATLQPNNGGMYGFILNEVAASTSPTNSSTSGSDSLSYGTNVTGTISNTIPLIRYRFQGSAGDVVTINMTAIGGDLDSYILLVDTSGTAIAQNDNLDESTTDAELTITLPESREYFIIATRRGQEQGITAGNFMLNLASDAPSVAPTTNTGQIPSEFSGLPQIVYGDTVEGTISNVKYIDFYVFYGEQGDIVEITMTTTSALDPTLILLDAGRIPLIEHDDISDSNKSSYIEFELPHVGYYAIVATRYDQENGVSEGSYQLSLDLTDGPAFTANQPYLERLETVTVVAGESPAGNFDPLRFAAIYTFPAVAGSLIDFAVTADGGTVASVILTDSNLNTISASNNGILLGITAPSSGDYVVFVAPQAGPAANISGGYMVALNAGSSGAITTSQDDESIPIRYGSQARGRISDETPEIRYVFQGNEGDVVEIGMNAEASAAPLDPYLILQNASGTVVAENDDVSAGVIRDAFIRTSLPASGEYTIVATRFSDATSTLSTGEFQLSLQYQDPALAGIDREASMLAYGQTVTSTITADLYLRFFYFSGQQGDEITLEVDTTEGTLDPVLYLYAMTSTDEFVLLTVNDDSELGNTYDPLISYTLPRSGGYLAVVTRYTETAADPTIGVFNISLRLNNPSQ